ncbi:MAG: winged helix-turn-helix domain-containing protein [Spirochaetales bacterium]|nr:winged helix-turn-helix domain-containing protein [Spirochaetales bacterium]
MKIKPRPDRKTILCNFIYTDEFLAQKVTAYFNASEHIAMHCSREAIQESETDCYIVPVQLIQSLLETKSRPSTWLPFMAYGSHFFLNEAFSRGCADYLKEPWECPEAELRLLKLFSQSSVYYLHGKEITLEGIRASAQAGSVVLSKSEMNILKALLKSAGNVVHRDVLYYTIWNTLPNKPSRVVDVHVSSLRKKLKTVFADQEITIHHVRGEGYLLE